MSKTRRGGGRRGMRGEMRRRGRRGRGGRRGGGGRGGGGGGMRKMRARRRRWHPVRRSFRTARHAERGLASSLAPASVRSPTL